MPLYEYECQSCHRRTEKIKSSSSAPPETICPYCGGPLVQALSAPAVQFKGSGWYVTDYAKSGAPPKKSSGASSAQAGGGDSSSSDKPSASTTTADSTATAPAKAESAAAPKASSSASAKSE